MTLFFEYIIPITQTLASIIACILAIWIPKKISWEQLYSNLLIDYYSYDFGAAIMGVVLFFNRNCENDIEKVRGEYIKQVKELFSDGCFEQSTVSNDNNLYYQRRLLTQFYYQLDLCARSHFIGQKRIQKDFSSKEANLLKVLFYMNEASTSPEIFMDISTDDRLPKKTKGINSYIKHIYWILKSSPDYIR